MKNLLFPLLLVCNIAFSQVGIETDTPQSALDINGSLQLRSDLKVNGSDSTEGNPGTVGQALVSQGEGQPAVWKNVLVPFLALDGFQMTNSYSKIGRTGISFPTGAGDGVHTSNLDDNLTSAWTVLNDLTTDFEVTNPNNKIALVFQSGVELSKTTSDNQNIKYICAAFVDGKLKAMRPNQIDAVKNKEKSQSLITLSYTILDIEPGIHQIQVGCRKISTTNDNLRLAIGRPSEGDGNTQTNNFTMQSIIKIDVIERLYFETQ